MPRILLVDDDPPLRTMLAAMLVTAGYEVETAADGAQALTAIGRSVPDVLVIDLVMPGKEGIETIMELRRSHPSLPVIAISGSIHGGAYLAVAERLGADMVLSKPFAPPVLINAITLVLSR